MATMAVPSLRSMSAQEFAAIVQSDHLRELSVAVLRPVTVMLRAGGRRFRWRRRGRGSRA
jgi:hypothetical protein